MSKVTFLHVSNQYYEKLYKRASGIDSKHSFNTPIAPLSELYEHYYAIDSTHYFEFPLWIAMMDGVFESVGIESKLIHLVNLDLDELRMDIAAALAESDYLLVSVMESNKQVYNDIFSKLNPELVNYKLIQGGYTEIDYGIRVETPLEAIEHIVNLESIATSKLQVSFRLNDTPTMMRFTLVEGCKYNCAFCTIPKNHKYHIFTEDEIELDLNVISKYDNYKYVYIDDKTFVTDTYDALHKVYDKLKNNNSFEGFIIQTTVDNVIPIVEKDKDNIIKYIEVGIEILDDKLLKLFRKPTNVKAIINMLDYFKKNDITNVKLVPNLLVAIPSVDANIYVNTAYILNNYRKYIAFTNIYSLALYPDTDLAAYYKDKFNIIPTQDDLDENRIEKSYNSPIDNLVSISAVKAYLGLSDYYYEHYIKNGIRD